MNPTASRMIFDDAGVGADGHPLGEENASGEMKNGFTIRTPDEILEMVFNDDDIILGDRMMAEGQSCVIAAAGGLGKSRIALQLPACVTTGKKFLNFITGK